MFQMIHLRPTTLQHANDQRVEYAARTFSTQALKLEKHGGLYSVLGRKVVGLIETDIDDLTATATGHADTVAASKGTALAKYLAKHGGGVLAGVLKPKKADPLLTVSPICFHRAMVSRSETGKSVLRTGAPYSSARPPSVRSHSKGDCHAARHGKRHGLRGAGQNEVTPEEALEASERVIILGADKNKHKKYVGTNLRRLRALLGESFQGKAGRSGSPSLFSVKELRVLGAAKRRRANVGRDASANKGQNEELEGDEQPAKQEGAQVVMEFSTGGNHMLRNLAIALLLSVQRRIPKDFLFLGFAKWRVSAAKIRRLQSPPARINQNAYTIENYTYTSLFCCPEQRRYDGWGSRPWFHLWLNE